MIKIYVKNADMKFDETTQKPIEKRVVYGVKRINSDNELDSTYCADVYHNTKTNIIRIDGRIELTNESDKADFIKFIDGLTKLTVSEDKE